MKPSKTKNEAMQFISVARDGRKKKYRIRVRNKFDASFSDLYTAKMIRDFEART
jgi:hypothetical protein